MPGRLGPNLDVVARGRTGGTLASSIRVIETVFRDRLVGISAWMVTAGFRRPLVLTNKVGSHAAAKDL